MNFNATDNSDEQLAQHLERNPGYRVLRQLNAELALAQRLAVVPEGAHLGLSLDTETTGKESTDKIVELGMVLFAYCSQTEQVLGVVDVLSELEDPGMPIHPAASLVNGITDEMVAGKRIDDARVIAMAERANFVVAHNSSFDRPKCEARFPFFKDMAWACSLRQVDWAGEGIKSGQLDYIAFRMGFFYAGHRAYIDCLALLEVLRQPMASLSGKSALSGLLAQYRQNSSRVWAANAPFEAKDILKDRGYRWNDGSAYGSVKAWNKEVTQDDLTAELTWLKETVYRNRSTALPVDAMTALTRFSDRNGAREMHYL